MVVANVAQTRRRWAMAMAPGTFSFRAMRYDVVVFVDDDANFLHHAFLVCAIRPLGCFHVWARSTRSRSAGARRRNFRARHFAASAGARQHWATQGMVPASNIWLSANGAMCQDVANDNKRASLLDLLHFFEVHSFKIVSGLPVWNRFRLLDPCEVHLIKSGNIKS